MCLGKFRCLSKQWNLKIHFSAVGETAQLVDSR